jgi:PAS domain S-box-containing protein
MIEKSQDNTIKDELDSVSTILVVEDDEGLSRLIAKSLKTIDVNVEVVHSGADAIDWIADNSPLITLMDYRLPDMTARQILENLKDRNIDFPFIVMTGHGDEKVAVEMMKAGARDYIVKQGQFFELLPSVIKWVFKELETEKKLTKANNALGKSEKKYRSIVDNALVGVYKSNMNGDMVYANHALSNMFGYVTPEEMMSGGILQIYKNKVDRDSLVTKLQASGCVDEFECECVKKDGSGVDIILTATLEDNVISGMMINITSRKRMEKILIQSEKLRAMGVMAAGIAHDFNNVLAIINGYTQLLEGSCEGNEELLNGFRAINKAVEDGSETVRRLSEFTRMEKSTAKHVSVNMVEVVEQSINFSKPKWKDVAQASGATYEIDTEGLTSVRDVLGNPAELREIVINLINNAIDAMSGGGRITFRTWEKGHSIFMSMADNGCGMSKEVQSKIFDPFYTTKGVEGSGLGMSVSYGIVGKHGGSIDVISQVGKGTVFTIELPIATETIFPETPVEPVIDIEAAKYHILVVDDVKEISDLLYVFLTRQGYNVDSVQSGDEAIKKLEKECYDLVICDLGMPQVSGWDVIKVADSLENKPKIGLITGWADMLDSLNKDDMGVDFIVSKPIKYKQLSTIIKETLLNETQEAVENSKYMP